MTIRPGVLEMLRETKAKGLKIASVSSTPVEVLKALMENLSPDMSSSSTLLFRETTPGASGTG